MKDKYVTKKGEVIQSTRYLYTHEIVEPASWLETNAFSQCQKHSNTNGNCKPCKDEMKTVAKRDAQITYWGFYGEKAVPVEGQSGHYQDIANSLLSDDQKLILFMLEQGFSRTQVADRFGISRQALNSRLNKIKARLAKLADEAIALDGGECLL